MKIRCVMERRGEVADALEPIWHACMGRGDADWQPIMCGQQDGSGINLPGNRERREPTCPSCIKALKNRR